MPRYPTRTRRTSDAELAERIKADLSVEKVFEFYGYLPNRNGYILCPFHNEKTASLKLYSGERPGWHCFGCGRGGTVIDFVMKLFNLSFQQAILRLCSDFGIHMGLDLPVPSRRQEVRELEAARRREAERKAAMEVEHRAAVEEYRYLWEIRQYFETEAPPVSMEDIHPLYAEALRRLSCLEYWLDIH